VVKPMSVIELNRFLFEGNVVNGRGGDVEHWMVLFCPHWYSPCKKVTPLFRDYSLRWEVMHNKNVMSSQARFGEVDCATGKELCNEQRIEEYPSVVHYQGGDRVSVWTAGNESKFELLGGWLTSELVLPHSEASRSNSGMARKKDVADRLDAKTMPWAAVSPLVAMALLVVFVTLILGFVATSSAPCPEGLALSVERTPNAASGAAIAASSSRTATTTEDIRTEKATLCMPKDWVRSRGVIDL